MLDEVGSPALKIMFDCYHLQILQGDLLRTFRDVRPQVGHIQFAGVPNRDEPDCGEVDYRWLLQAILEAGYDGYFGAEYRPRRDDFDVDEAPSRAGRSRRGREFLSSASETE